MQLEVFRFHFFLPFRERGGGGGGLGDSRFTYTFIYFKLRHHIVEFKSIFKLFEISVVIFIRSLQIRLSKHNSLLFVEE